MYLLDTDHLGILQRRTRPEIDRLLPRIFVQPAAFFYVSIVSFHEQVLDWNTYISRARDAAGTVRGYQMFLQLLTEFAQAQVLPFGDPASAIFESLRAQRVRVATMDLRIAAIALDRDLTLLTRNAVDFNRVPGLRFEDWTL